MSTWNVDNYHWEEHNFNKWAEEHLKKLAEGVNVEGWTLSDRAFDGVVAARNIRKNKEIRSFEFSFTCKFEYNGMQGKIHFQDVSNDAGDDGDWEAEVSFTGESQKKDAAAKKPVRAAAEKELIPAFRKAFSQFVTDFKSLPSPSPSLSS